MPFPNEHSCRLRDPGDFQDDSFRRTSREHEGKRYDVIMGRLKDETTMTEQAFRYPKGTWAPGEARSHCGEHDGTFEAASDEGEETLSVSELVQDELSALDYYRRGLAPPPLLYRGLADGYRVQPKEQEDGLVSFVASEETEDRLGSIIKASGWELDNFKKNPVFLYVHDLTFPPLGSVLKVEVSGKQLLASVRFDDQDEFAAMIHRKYANGFMRGVSVGFHALDFEQKERQGESKGDISETLLVFTKQELVELSAVPVPANPRTLKKALGQRSRFWIPYTSELTVSLDSSGLQKSLETLQGSISNMLVNMRRQEDGFTSQTNEKPDEWDEVLQGVKRITGKGGNK